MAKNMIQFQKGKSIHEFMSEYGTEDKCQDSLFRLRWPNGFRCPNCGSSKFCELKSRELYQCHRCHHQTSVKAGTIFQSTHLPLTKWFLGIYLMTQNKNGISALELSRQLGVSYNASWRLKHKLMQVMLERDSKKKLSGRVEIDDAYLGAKRVSGKRGRGAGRKTPFVAAVETDCDKKPLRIKLSKLHGFQKEELKRWGNHHLEPEAWVVSDGLSCFQGIELAGFQHEPHVTGSGKAAVAHPSFKWVNIILGNLKNALSGTYHAINRKHVPRYLAEFQYRFNRRYDLPSMIQKLIYVALRTPPMPSTMLSMAEAEW